MSDIGSGDEGISSQSTYFTPAALRPSRPGWAPHPVHNRRDRRPRSTQRSKVNISLFPFQNGDFGFMTPPVTVSESPGARGKAGGDRAGPRPAPVASRQRLMTYRFFCLRPPVGGRAGVGGRSGAPAGAASADEHRRAPGTAARSRARRYRITGFSFACSSLFSSEPAAGTVCNSESGPLMLTPPIQGQRIQVTNCLKVKFKQRNGPH